LRIGLFDPGMTALHRAGLAGLWMTLRSIERDHLALLADLQRDARWTLGLREVTIAWEDEAAAERFYSRLVKEAFRVTSDGRIYLLARGNPQSRKDGGIPIQDALLWTFLQHGKFRDADPSNKPTGAITVEIDEQQYPFSYRKVRRFAHQRATYKEMQSGDVVSWLLPGGAVRHDAFKADSQLRESLGGWLALLFAPVGVLYFRVRRRSAGINPGYCLVVPDVEDLSSYARVCRSFDAKQVRDPIVSGTADAALRVLAEEMVRTAADDYRVTRCGVIGFGVVPWASQLKSRVDLFEAGRVGERGLRQYLTAVQLLGTRVRAPSTATGRRAQATDVGDEVEPGRPTFVVSPVLDLVARNVVAGRPWWRGFTSLVLDKEQWAQLQTHQFAMASTSGTASRGGIAEMVSRSDMFDQAGAETVVRACHEAWHRRMGALSARARVRGESARDLISRERERLRIDFAHCKNVASLRATLTDFWARADSSLPSLQQGWRDVLPYLTDARWQEARDLALLALVSYARRPDDPSLDADDGVGAENA
jgi:CRISPR-associated protein Cas8a1/Csx13